MNQIQLRQGITLKQILAAVATLPSLKEQINEIQTQLNNKDFVSADETGEKRVSVALYRLYSSL